jgi:hypothetical protein
MVASISRAKRPIFFAELGEYFVCFEPHDAL